MNFEPDELAEWLSHPITHELLMRIGQEKNEYIEYLISTNSPSKTDYNRGIIHILRKLGRLKLFMS